MTDEQLREIEIRADNPCEAGINTLVYEDVPALIAEIRRLKSPLVSESYHGEIPTRQRELNCPRTDCKYEGCAYSPCCSASHPPTYGTGEAAATDSEVRADE